METYILSGSKWYGLKQTKSYTLENIRPESSSSKEEFARGEARHGQDFVATLVAVTFSVRDGNGLHTGLVTLSSWGSHVFATSTAEASRKFSESSSSVTVLSSFVLLRIMYVVSMTKP
ncbi:unnamed protein product [Brassica oleracea]